MTIDAVSMRHRTDWRQLVMNDTATVEPALARSARDSKEGNTMAFTIDSRQRGLSKFKRAESLEFRLIYIAAFAVFLVAATVERLLPFMWRRRNAEAGVRKSIIQQARDAANTCAAYAFMG